MRPHERRSSGATTSPTTANGETVVVEAYFAYDGIEEQADGTLHVSGEGQDLLLAPDDSAMVLYERGFSWGVRADDPFNR